MRTADYWVTRGDNKVICSLCPHSCVIAPGGSGRCRVRRNKDGVLIAESYGKITALALDPIEKKPFSMFYPGSSILSLGSYGCNMCCPFCQNHELSMGNPPAKDFTPEDIAQLCAELSVRGNLGAAYTYNEPLISIEFIKDCAKLISAQGQKNVLVTNGLINREPLEELLEYIDAMNIDIKCISGYDSLGGDLECVLQTLRLAAPRCHVEITSLIVPGLNDNSEDIAAIARLIASVSRSIPLHISRYFPRYKTRIPATDVSLIHKFAGLACKYLDYVRVGNC